MRPLILYLGVVLAAAPVGCGAAPAPAPSASPLTVEQWKALPTQTKYEVETLERLKLGDPRLQDQRAWDKFTRDVLIPAKKKDQSVPPAK